MPNVQSGVTTSGAEGKLAITQLGSVASGISNPTGVVAAGSTKEHLRVYDWELSSDPGLQSDASAESGGVQHRAPVIYDFSCTFNVRISSGFQPEDTVVGLIEGQECQLYLRVGTLTGHNNWKHIIGPVRKKGCDVNGFAMYSVTTYAQEAKPALTAWSD